MNRSTRFLVGGGVVVLILLGASGVASAHAQLEWTRPVQSSVVSISPTQVVLHFGEPVEIDFGSLRVIGPNGQRVDDGGTHHPPGDSHSVAISLPSHLSRGTYVVAWRVISADSHPVHGAFVFSVGSTTGAAKANALANILSNESGSTAVGVIYWFIRFAAFVGLEFLVGIAFMVAVVWRIGAGSGRVGRMLWASWIILLASTVLGIAIQGVYAAALPLTDIVRPSLIGEVLQTHFGKIELLRLALLVAFVPVILGLRGRIDRPGTRWRWLIPLGAALGIALLFTPGLAGHAATGSDVGLGLSLDVFHLLAAAVWLGGLALLAALLLPGLPDGDRPPDIWPIAVSVSAIAFSAVVVVVGTGVVQSIRQVGSLYALFNTAYGRTLLVKIALVILLVGVGALSRRIVLGRWGMRSVGRVADGTPERGSRVVAMRGAGGELATAPGTGTQVPTAQLAEPAPAGRPTESAEVGTIDDDPDGEADARRARTGRLRRSVLAEITIAVAVLAVTALLVNSVPAKQAAGQPFSQSFNTLGVQVNVIVDPARAGPATQFHFYVLGTQGVPKAIPELDASISLPARGLGPLTIPLVNAGPGHYFATNVDIPIAGTWILTLTVRTSAIDEQEVSAPLPVH